MSLLGMYYALSDVITYYYNNHIVKTDTVVEENDVSQDNNLTEEVIYEDDDNDDDNDDDEGSDEVAEDDEFDNDSSEKTTTMMTSVFRRTTPVNTYDTENEARNIKAIEQLKAYADMIHQKNLENKYRESDDDYSDMPPLVKISSNSWYTSNLPPYMNPNLRQSGHYAPSQNETDE
jgi:hypothetical protein